MKSAAARWADVRRVARPGGVLVGLFVLALSGPLFAYKVPEGVPVLRNGSFTEGGDRPLYWVTRATGDLGTFAVAPPAEGATSGVLTVRVERGNQQPWMLELRQKLTAELPKGRNLFLGFEYKISNGYAFHVYWQKDSPPWPKFLALRLSEPVGEWTPCMVAVPVPEDLSTDQTSLSFHLAEVPGTLELRNLTVVLVAEHVDIGTIETNYQPVFGGDYYDNDWRSAVMARIEKERKVDLVVDVSAAGSPASGAAVQVEQTGRPFLLGVELPATLLVDDLLETEEGAPLKRAMGDALPSLPKLRAKVGDPALFGLVTLSDALTWRNYDTWGKGAASKAIQAIRARGQQVRGSAAYNAAFRDAPPKCREMDREELLQALQKHVRQIVSDQKGQIAQWVVLHGMLGCSEIYDAVGVESLIGAFQIAQQQDPAATLLVSDNEALLLPGDSRVGELVEFVTWLRTEGAKVSGIVLGASLARPYMAPQTIEKRLDLIAASGLGLPVFISSLELESDKEALQEGMLRDLLALFFSHRVVAGVSFSNVWEPAAMNRKCALYRADMTPRKAGKTVETLFSTEWATHVKGVTDAQGQFTTRAFIGTYRISAEIDGKTVAAEVEVTPAKNRVTLKAK